MIVIRLVEQLADVVGTFGLFQESAKRLIAQLPRNVFQCSQMIPWPIGRGNQQEKKLHFLAVEAVEIDAAGLTPTVPTSRSTLGCLVCGTATPRPIPVLPSSSRFITAFTTLSTSLEPILPASFRASAKFANHSRFVFRG